MTAWAAAEGAEIRRARVRISLLVGLAITVMIAFVGGIAYTVMVQGQNALVSRELRYNARFGVPGTAPKCAWVFELHDGTVDLGALEVPQGFPLYEDLATVNIEGTTVERALGRNGTVYHVLTQPGRNGGTVQAVFDTRYQLADRRNLLLALAIAQVAGLIAAALTGLGVSRRTVAPLAEALARQRRFVTDASHELRTPIARAYLRAQLLARLAAAADLPGDPRNGLRDGLDQLAKSIRGLGDVVDDLLLSARLSQHQGRAVDLAAVADSAVQAEGERAAERRIALALTRPAGPLVVIGVETALRRAVDELLANAVRHTQEGGRIDVRLRLRDGQVELEVADTGEGFDPAEADRIFDRFHHGAGGLGLGLALVREIVTGHGGTVEAVGHTGRGARFTLMLPLATQLQTDLVTTGSR